MDSLASLNLNLIAASLLACIRFCWLSWFLPKLLSPQIYEFIWNREFCQHLMWRLSHISPFLPLISNAHHLQKRLFSSINLAAGRYIWKMFLTRAHLALPPLCLVPHWLIDRFIFISQLPLHRWTQLKITKSELLKTNLTNPVNFYECTISTRCLHLHLSQSRSQMYPDIRLFYAVIGHSVQCSADYTFHKKLHSICSLLYFRAFALLYVVLSVIASCCLSPSIGNLAVKI